jgi:hypothetical protein
MKKDSLFIVTSKARDQAIPLQAIPLQASRLSRLKRSNKYTLENKGR